MNQNLPTVAVQAVINERAKALQEEGITGEEAAKALMEMLGSPEGKRAIIQDAEKRRRVAVSKVGKRIGLNRAARRRAEREARSEAKRRRKVVSTEAGA